jgi:capsular polysaccharide transport system permease protein
MLTVLLPVAVAIIYFGVISADRYESESRFVVRSPSSAAASQLSSIVQGGSSGVMRSTDDAFIIHAYMRSRDAVRKLVGSHDLMARLGRPEADFYWTYPGIFRRHTEERLWRHFQNFLTIDFDSSTGITTLKVQGFRADDARVLADALLADSERLINVMSERAQKEAVQTASREVEKNRGRAREALDRITDFRRRNAMIDPGRVSAAALETITRLSLEIARTTAELSELKLVSPDSPQANSLRQRIVAYDEQILKERNALAGKETSLAPLIAEYERLLLEREFEEKTFASAQSALDIARIDAERQRLFLERISTPGLADYPKYPNRLLGIFGVFFVTFLLFSIARRLMSDTRAHAGQ